MKTIHVEVILYQGIRRINLYFKYNDDLIERIRKIEGARWSWTLKCWYLPYSDYCINEIGKLITDKDVSIPQYVPVELVLSEDYRPAGLSAIHTKPARPATHIVELRSGNGDKLRTAFICSGAISNRLQEHGIGGKIHTQG